jgi:iron-sulfur cluster assembly protein
MNIEIALGTFSKTPYQPKGITLTDAAYVNINQQLEDRNGSGLVEDMGIGIRFGVTGAGCGGYQYVVEYVDVDKGEDHVFQQDNVKIFVDKKSILMIDGLQVDFKTQGFSSGLEFSNPLAGQACGCGESFSLK